MSRCLSTPQAEFYLPLKKLFTQFLWASVAIRSLARLVHTDHQILHSLSVYLPFASACLALAGLSRESGQRPFHLLSVPVNADHLKLLAR